MSETLEKAHKLKYRVRTPHPNGKTILETSDPAEAMATLLNGKHEDDIWNEVDITGGSFSLFDVGIFDFGLAILYMNNHYGWSIYTSIQGPRMGGGITMSERDTATAIDLIEIWTGHRLKKNVL